MAHWQDGGEPEADVTFCCPLRLRARVEYLWESRRRQGRPCTRKALYIELLEAGLARLEKAAARAAEGAQKGAGAAS